MTSFQYGTNPNPDLNGHAFGSDGREDKKSLNDIDHSVFDLNVTNDYYDKLYDLMLSANPEQFGLYVLSHESKILDTKFDEPSEQIFQNQLQKIAIEIIVDQSTRRFKKPCDISDSDMEKLEVLRRVYEFDYWKSVEVPFTSQHSYRGVEAYSRSDRTFEKTLKLGYQEPLSVYLVKGNSDLTDKQAAYLSDLLDRQVGSAGMLKSDYATNASEGRQLQGRNMLHAMLETSNMSEHPLKARVARRLLEEFSLGDSLYWKFAARSEWNSPQNRNFSGSNFYQLDGVYHAAVASGIIGNIEFLAEQNIRVIDSGGGCDYGGNPFAYAAEIMGGSQQRQAIATRVLEIATKQSTGYEITKGGYLASEYTSYPIQRFAQSGNLEMVVLLATFNAGVPVVEVEIINDKAAITLGNYQASNGTFHPRVEANKTITSYLFSVTGKDMLTYVKQAVFNNLDGQGRYYQAYKNIFDKAVTFLKESGVLTDDDIPVYEGEKFVDFAKSLRNIALEVVQQDPSFLCDEALFTDQFSEIARKAKQATNNFQTVYTTT
jgi:hypothetical protein